MVDAVNPEVVRRRWPEATVEMEFTDSGWVITDWKHQSLPQPNQAQLDAAVQFYNGLDFEAERINMKIGQDPEFRALIQAIAETGGTTENNIIASLITKLKAILLAQGG